MSEYSYLASLKNKEFLILQKLCDNSIPQDQKEKLQKDLQKTRDEIQKLE